MSESRPGFSVLVHMLGGDRGQGHLRAAIGKVIASAEMVGGESEWGRRMDGLALRFTDGTGIRFADEGQSCCEHRYMRTDDDLSYHVGAKLVDAELVDAPGIQTEDDYGEVHEVQFLNIVTDRGRFQIASHNEHNGYYGGFWIQVSELPASPPDGSSGSSSMEHRA